MNTTAVLLVTLVLLLGPADVARATNMFAGPLFTVGDDTCECEIVNVTTAAKNVQVIALDSAGEVLSDTGVFSLPAGQAVALITGSSGQQYCKFVNASPTNFRASIACFFSGATSAGSDFIALPAR